MPNIKENVDLSEYNSMKLGGKAKYFLEATNQDELINAIMWAQEKDIVFRVIGGGYNILFTDDGFDGLIILNHIKGFDTLEENGQTVTLQIGAGEDWDSIVGRSVEMGLSGIESLSLIPGSVGAAPIQNIGAYGQELSTTLKCLTVYDTQQHISQDVTNTDCDFGYRTSRFKHTFPQREIITSITLTLRKAPTLTRPLYSDIEAFFSENNLCEPTPENVRKAVIAVRQAKLPDPAQIPNTGSFFGNPIISKEEQVALITKWPELENWESKVFNKKSQAFWETKDGNVKVAAGMLLEHAGLVDYHDEETGMATWKTQGLVLVNEHAQSSKDLFTFRDYIIKTIQERYGITFEQEPETIIA